MNVMKSLLPKFGQKLISLIYKRTIRYGTFLFTEIGIHVVTQNNTYTRRHTKCDIISIIFNENGVNSKRFP